MNPTFESTADLAAAHPLFPPDQAFLWLPGLPGKEQPYCSYNVLRSPGAVLPRPGVSRGKNASLAPPNPVSPVTFISWDPAVNPPFPYHPLPVARVLSRKEIRSLALRVIRLSGGDPGQYPDPVAVLKNGRKCLVIAALAEMGLLATATAPEKEQAG